MKRLLTFLIVSLLSLSVFAQSAAELKNSGNKALRSKNYKLALEKYEAYFKVLEGKDNASVFNAAYCATKLKDYDKAVVYFSKSIKNRYKTTSAYKFKAIAYKKQNKEAQMVATLEEGLKAKPGNKKLEKLLYVHFLKKGTKLQKANKAVEARECFKKVAKLNTKKFKGDAFYSLGASFCNEGAMIIEKARPYANTKREKFAEEKGKAVKLYKEGIKYLDKALALNPNSESAKKTKEEALKTIK